MTDSTTDAAKLLRELAADATPTNEGDSDRLVLTSETKVALLRIACEIEANTRPQPAPPEGEPVAWAVKDFADGWIIFDTEDRARISAETTGALVVRLGLAARPKVEDAEVAQFIESLRYDNDQPWKLDAADLLERLAGDLQNWWSAAIVAMKAQEAAEAKLVEREAELAKADAVIEGMSIGLAGAPTEWSDSDEDAATKRHAARQQQKS